MPIIALVKEGETKKIEASTLKEVYQKLKINPTIVLAIRNDELIIETAVLKPNDKITIIPVISGG